jgi:hypothetical protein
MVGKKTFIGPNIQGNSIFPAEGGQKWQFRLYLHPGMEAPGVHRLGKQALCNLL